MALQTTMMDSKMTLRRPTVAQVQGGTVYSDFPVVEFDGEAVADVACSCQPAGKHDQLLYEQRNTTVDSMVYTPQEIGAEVSDIIQVTRSTGTVEVYRVKGEDQEGGMRERLWSTACEKIK